jgi:uncharacterized membrane protein YagU involved in acid resistance
MRAARKAGVDVDSDLDEDERNGLTLLAHFGYGTAVGALYAPIAPRGWAASTLGGVGYGLLVWAGSYLGLLPAIGLLSPATRHPPRRNALMIAAHVVWGATLGAVAGAVRPHGEARCGGAQTAEPRRSSSASSRRISALR